MERHGAELHAWLLEGDPAVRWRVLQYLDGASKDAVARERARVATEGWGARLLAAQDDDGGWGGGVYSPKWTSTTYTLLHLLWLGLPPGHPAALRGCEGLWRWQARWRVPETCIVSMIVRLTSYHGYQSPRLDEVVTHLLDQQLADGGWNCDASPSDKGKHSSFHTTVQALEALTTYTRTGGSLDSTEEQRRGRDFFLRHRLYQSHRTGQVAIRGGTRFPIFPSGISMCFAGWNTSPTSTRPETSDSVMLWMSYVVPAARMAHGRSTPPTRAGSGSSRSRPGRAAGTPAVSCGC